MEPSLREFQLHLPMQKRQRLLFAPSKTPIRSKKLVKMKPGDDPETFLRTFECAARAARWPKEEWAMYLALLLSGEARAIYQTLPNTIAEDYDALKEAILDRLSVSEKSYQIKFRSLTFAEGANPRTVVNKLRDWGWRWLKPDIRSSADIVELIIMEQFLQILPIEVAEWISHHKLWSLEIVVQLVEDYLAAEKLGPASARGVSPLLLSAEKEEPKIVWFDREEAQELVLSHDGIDVGEGQTRYTLRLDTSEEEYEDTEEQASEDGTSLAGDESKCSSPERANQWKRPTQREHNQRDSSCDAGVKKLFSPKGAACPNFPAADKEQLHLDQRQIELDAAWTMWRDPVLTAEYSPVREKNSVLAQLLPNPETSPWNTAVKTPASLKKIEGMSLDDKKKGKCTEESEVHDTLIKAKKTGGRYSQHAEKKQIDHNFYNLKRISWRKKTLPARFRLYQTTDNEGSVRKLAVFTEQQRTHTCTECGKSFSLKKKMIAHQSLHKGEGKQKPNLETIIPKEQNQKCDRQYSEHAEISKLDNKSYNERRIPRRKKVLPARCRPHQTMDNEGGIRNLEILPEEQGVHKCNDCGKSFSLKKMIAHQSLHKGEKKQKSNLEPIFTKEHYPKCDLVCSELADNSKIDDTSHNEKRILDSQEILPARNTPYETTDYDGGVTKLADLTELQGTHTCTDCGKSFGLKEMMIVHQKLHKVENKQKSNLETLAQREKNHNLAIFPLKDKSYTCHECGKNLMSASSLKRHKQTHSEFKQYLCEVCGRSFAQSNYLILHARIHTGQKPYTCDECGRSFSWNANLKKHQHSHTRKMPYTCGYCGKSFNESSILVSHRRTHTGEKPYTCGECGKGFTLLACLTLHHRLHTEEKPYTSNEYGRSFRVSNGVMRPKEIQTGHKPYTCNTCGKSFLTLTRLVAHETEHTGEKPNTCGECGKSFRPSTYLISHHQIHTGENPYKCSECGKGFCVSDCLLTHKQIHMGEKPYTCTECGQTFTILSDLVVHHQIHAREQDLQYEKLPTINLGTRVDMGDCKCVKP